MDFKEIPPEWKNEGVEPNKELKDKGFTAGYKPPASYFNWFWNIVGRCIEEIQKKLKGVEEGANKYIHPSTHSATMITEDSTHRFLTDAERTANTNHIANKSNPHTVKKEQIGLSNVDNTADSEKRVSYAETAGNASTVNEHTVNSDVPANAKFTDTIYTHPSTHPATMITEDALHKFVTDAEKANLADTDSKKHTHTNKSVLDSITQALINTWNTVSNKVDKVAGKQLSTNDYTNEEKNALSDVNTKKHTHTNKSILDVITQLFIDNWNTAYSHISDAVKHITSAERSLWNTVSNKVDKISGKGLSSNDFTTAQLNKLNGISDGANNYSHPATHPPSIITQDSNNRFVTDAEKVAWNNKADNIHTHNYAGSASVGGAANSANKLSSTRTITLEGAMSGSINFDGSQNVTLITQEGTVSFKRMGEIGNTTDWNLIREPGCYKVQISAWGDVDVLHGPNQYANTYSYGMLLVFSSYVADSEKRTLQIYFPHSNLNTERALVLLRMLNANVWQDWQPLFKGIDKNHIGLSAVINEKQYCASG